MCRKVHDSYWSKLSICRIFAAQALINTVVDGIVSREEVLEFLGSVLTGDEAKPDSELLEFFGHGPKRRKNEKWPRQPNEKTADAIHSKNESFYRPAL